jgi:hypothetical protein
MSADAGPVRGLFPKGREAGPARGRAYFMQKQVLLSHEELCKTDLKNRKIFIFAKNLQIEYEKQTKAHICRADANKKGRQLFA